ncbi:MAG: DMT family transporter [Actinomycetota bacterium]|nr:DMT family transporter [Actinomycetota bacterium]
MALAVLAAAANATASVLQRKAARSAESRSFSIGLLFDLVHRPIWIAGVGAVVAGFSLHLLALDNGPVTLVQPVLVVELPFTLLLGSRLLGAHLARRDRAAVAGIAVGLAGLLFALAPSGGDTAQVRVPVWLSGIASTLVAVAALIGMSRRRSGRTRALLLGAASGVGFGLTAVLAKAVTGAFGQGLVGVLTSWQTYLLLALGPATFFLLQNALQAGSLVASQPAMLLANPAVATTWGIVVFGEQIRAGGWLVLAFVALLLIVVGVVLLTSSPLFSQNVAATQSDEAGPGPEHPSTPGVSQGRGA